MVGLLLLEDKQSFFFCFVFSFELDQRIAPFCSCIPILGNLLNDFIPNAQSLTVFFLIMNFLGFFV